MDFSWPIVTIALAVTAAVIVIAILAKRESHKTRRFRVGFFWERDHFEEERRDDELRDE